MARRGRGPKPAKPTSMDAVVPKKLTDADVEVRQKRFNGRYRELRALKKQKARVTREINEDIKTTEAELDKLSNEIDSGMEELRQGDLFAPTKDRAKQALGQVAAAVEKTMADQLTAAKVDPEAASVCGWCVEDAILARPTAMAARATRG